MTDAERIAFQEQQMKALRIGMTHLRKKNEAMMTQLINMTMKLYGVSNEDATKIVNHCLLNFKDISELDLTRYEMEYGNMRRADSCCQTGSAGTDNRR